MNDMGPQSARRFTPGSTPRYPGVSRRAFLQRSALAGLALAAVPALAACGGSTPASSVPDSVGPIDTSPTPTDGATTTTGAVDPATSAATAIDETVPTSAASQDLAAGTALQIDFTFQAAGGGRVDSPFIAVWIENPAGELVQTVSLWYKSDESKYLADLKRWNSKNNRDALTTGATRIPGSFSVAWNGTDLDGVPVPAGDYFVCIEAAREDGPYQLVRESVAVSGAMSPTTLTPNGELVAASVQVVQL